MKTKKILFILVAMVMALSCIGITAMAEESSTGVAKIGDVEYADLQAAINAAENGDTITLLSDIEQADGVCITNKNLTIDLNGKTFKVTEGASTNNRNFKVNGSSNVTIKNGTLIAGGDYSSGAYGTVRTDDTANVTLTGLKLYNYRGNGLNIKACSGTTVNISDTEIYSQYGGGIESAGGTIELNNVKVEQKGMYTAPYNSMAISVNGGGTVTVNSGTYSTECITAEEANGQGTSHGPWVVGVLNSGGTLIVNGGTFSNDNFGENALATAARGAVLADTGAKIQINGGTFNALKGIVDIQNNLGNAEKNPTGTISGGTFSADPTNNYVTITEGYEVSENEDGTYSVAEVAPTYVAKVDGVEYADLQAAIDAANNGDTIVVLADMTFESELADAGKGYFNIPDGKKVAIDLNEKTINVTENSAGNFILFYNYGELTIKNGTVNLTSIQNRGWNAESAIILNRGGVLNVESGTFTHLGGTDMAFVVDNSGNWFGEATANIEGGSLTSSYIAIRNRMEQNEHGYSGTAYLNIAGGTISGNSRAVWAQASSTSEKSPATGVINVTGGNIGKIDTARSSGAVCMTTVSGGTVASFKVEKGELKITGGTVTGTLTILDASGNTVESDEIISGGTFSSDVKSYLADGCTLTENGDGTYSVESEGTLATENVLIQNMAQGTTATGDPTYRVGCFAAIDSANYSLLGIEVKADNGKVTGSGTTQYLYTYINVTNSKGEVTKILPETLGETNKYIFGRIMAFTTNYTDFSFRPFAVSLDGKKTFYGNWSKEYTVDPE